MLSLLPSNISIVGCFAQVTSEDFVNFDHILCMDDNLFANMEELRQFAPAGAKARVLMLGAFDPLSANTIPDPMRVSGPG
jgi:protein-tyrosine-phosphatase